MYMNYDPGEYEKVSNDNNTNVSNYFQINEPMNLPNPKAVVIPFNVQARIKIRIAGAIAFKPSAKESVYSLKVKTFLGI